MQPDRIIPLDRASTYELEERLQKDQALREAVLRNKAESKAARRIQRTKDEVVMAIEAHSTNKAAAEDLGVSPAVFKRLAEEHGLKTPADLKRQ